MKYGQIQVNTDKNASQVEIVLKIVKILQQIDVRLAQLSDIDAV